jgi:hypothetical protein
MASIPASSITGSTIPFSSRRKVIQLKFTMLRYMLTNDQPLLGAVVLRQVLVCKQSSYLETGGSINPLQWLCNFYTVNVSFSLLPKK